MNAESITRSHDLLAGWYTLAASLIWGVNTLLLLGAGLSVGEVFIASSLFSAGMVVFEIPTGAEGSHPSSASHRGRRGGAGADVVGRVGWSSDAVGCPGGAVNPCGRAAP